MVITKIFLVITAWLSTSVMTQIAEAAQAYVEEENSSGISYDPRQGPPPAKPMAVTEREVMAELLSDPNAEKCVECATADLLKTAATGTPEEVLEKINPEVLEQQKIDQVPDEIIHALADTIEAVSEGESKKMDAAVNYLKKTRRYSRCAEAVVRALRKANLATAETLPGAHAYLLGDQLLAAGFINLMDDEMFPWFSWLLKSERWTEFVPKGAVMVFAGHPDQLRRKKSRCGTKRNPVPCGHTAIKASDVGEQYLEVSYFQSKKPVPKRPLQGVYIPGDEARAFMIEVMLKRLGLDDA